MVPWGRPGAASVPLLAAALAALLLAGCAAPAEPPGSREPVAVALKWTHGAEAAGFYLADELGLYRDAGIEVRWREGGPSALPVHDVAAGTATFAIAAPSALLRARSAGHDVVAIAALYQQSPVGFFAFAETGIARPHDMVGKRVAYTASEEPFLRGMFRALGLDAAAVVQVPLTLDLAPWFDGRADVWSGYVMDQAADARAAGRAVNVIYPDDWGVHLYDDVIVTRGSVARERPGLVGAFLAASLDGWRRAIEDPEAAQRAVLAADPGLDPAKQRAFLQASAPLIQTGLAPLGGVDRARWADLEALLEDEGLVPPGSDLSGALDLRFLEEVYGR